MNNVYENDMRFLPLLKFIDKYKKLIVLIIFLIVGVSSFILITNQIQKQKTEEAALIYSDWLIEFEQEKPDTEKLNQLLDQFLNNYRKTGYTQLALLSKANHDAILKNYEDSLVNFNELIVLTDGFNGNKIFNKIGRVSSSRILFSMEKYDEALKMIEIYTSSDTNAFIHELTGDILIKQSKSDLALKQYKKAESKYIDETSKSIISMKIASIGT